MAEANRTVPDFPLILHFEANFDRGSAHDWISKRFNVSVVASMIYLIAIRLGQLVMKSRRAMDLKRPLIVWNAGLAIFSAFVCFRQLHELTHVLIHLGWKHSVCSFSFYEASPVSGVWVYLFVLSKLVELFDTIFLVLRKKKVIFLHWFHHASVLVFTWFVMTEKFGSCRWFMGMNASVHFVMYTYYALSAMGLKIPRAISICITSMQMGQMVLGLLVSLQAFSYWVRGQDCNVRGITVLSSILLYAAYLLLFLNFFAKTYLVPGTKKTSFGSGSKNTSFGLETKKSSFETDANKLPCSPDTKKITNGLDTKKSS